MFVGRTIRFGLLWHFGWPNALRVALLSTAVYFAYTWLHWTWLAIPFLPVSTVGAAVAFYVGFKNNSAYERLWEARRIWGGITNSSRSFAMSTLSLLGPDHPRQRLLIYRQLAWANALRLQLRQPSALNASHADLPHVTAVLGHAKVTYAAGLEAELTRLIPPEEWPSLLGANSATNLLLARQVATLVELKRAKVIDEYEHSDLTKHLVDCVQQQGAAERIKSFPFPRQYANFSLLFVNIFLALLPFGLIREMAALGPTASWMVIPFSVLIGWVFYTMEQVGDASENPFENSLNDTPLSAICRNLEIDLRELLGETNLPAKLQPVDEVLF